MKIPDGFYVLFQPKYKTPSIFDLHESGQFKVRPAVTKEHGFRLIVNEEFQIKIQYLHIVEQNGVDENTGIGYNHVNKEIFIDLMENLTLDKEKLVGSVPDDDIRDEILQIHKEWYDSYIPLDQNGEIDRIVLGKKLAASINEGQEIIKKELIRKNNSWIQAALPRLIHDFNHGLYQRMSDRLYPDYTSGGGEDTEKGLIKKINLFNRIYESEDIEALLKPNGSTWQNEDEIWNCWVAFAGSESEAKRICSTMATIFRPVSEELSRELNSQ